MSETAEKNTMAGLPGHARALREAIDSLIDGLGVLEEMAETVPHPGSPGLDWTIAKLNSDAMRVDDAARHVERALRGPEPA